MAPTAPKSDKQHALIYVLAGKEQTLVIAQLRALLDELIEPPQRVTGLLDVDGRDITLPEVLDELRTLPFLADKRVVVVRNASDFISQNREHLEKYFDAPCPTGVLILVVETWPANTRLARKLPKIGRLIKSIQPKGRNLLQRLSEYARDAHRIILHSNTAELLVDLGIDGR